MKLIFHFQTGLKGVSVKLKRLLNLFELFSIIRYYLRVEE